MKIKIINYFTFIIFVLTASGLFMIKNEVVILNYQLTQINKQIFEEKNKIYLLKAEISYLTSPNILRQYAANTPELKLVKVDQIICNPASKKEQDGNKIIITTKPNIAQGTWRYKKSPNKYLQQAVMRKK